MDILLGSDHAGIDLKKACLTHLKIIPNLNLEDMGVFSKESSDYPNIAHQLAKAVAEGRYDRGILICGTGLGMSIAANRHRGVRAALCHNGFTAKMARLHNDANVLVMGGRDIGIGPATEMVDIFLNTPFEGGRHQRRVELIDGEE